PQGVRDCAHALARGHRRPRDRPANATNLVSGAGRAGPGAAFAAAGDRQPLPGARRRLAAAGSANLRHGGPGEPMGQYQAMKISIGKVGKDRRNILIGLAGVFALAVIGAIVTQALLGAGRQPGRGRGGDEGPVPVLVATATIADVPVYIDGVGTTRALNTV